MKILALDAAGAVSSVALTIDGRLAARRDYDRARGQAEILIPLIEAVLAEAGCAIDAIDRFAVGIGPGGFTGLRIAIATARGLALATGRPLIGISGFEALAHGLDPAIRRNRTVVAVIDSQRADPYLQGFDADLVPLGAPITATAGSLPALLIRHATGPAGADLVGAILVGDGIDRLRADLAGIPDLVLRPAAVDAAVIAGRAECRPLPAPLPSPLYLRPPDVTLPAGQPDADRSGQVVS